MNASQVSSSPPGPAYSSPPVSPTVTQASSRSPTPSPTELHDNLSEVALRSSSPPRSHSPSSQLSNMSSRPGGTTDNDRTVPASAAVSQRPPLPGSASSAPAGRLPLLPHGTSHYVDAYLPTSAVATSSTSLAELAHLIRLQGYQEQRRCHARVRLHRWLVSSALSARLVHCGELVHRTLVDYFRSDDKKSFATLYNAIHDVRNSCDATRRYALLEPDLEFGRSKLAKMEKINSFSTFMHEIPQKVRDELLSFISELRTNPDFLATRITSLTPQELASLTAFRQALDPIESVMALRGKQVGAGTKPSPQTPSPVERLLSFQRHDPLSSLIYTIFASSSGPDSAEDLRRTEAWATTCARLITEGKHGSDKFILSVLDAWAGMREWPGKTNLELYLMQVLQDGQFLLEKAEDQPVRPRTQQSEARSTKDTIAAEEFYDGAVKRLFEVIDDEPSAGGIPEGVLEIGRAILRKLEDSRKHRTAASTFIVSRWFFSTYLLSAIIHPETQGIMTGHHISELARQKILKEIAIRSQKQVLDMTYNWKQAVPILPEIRAHIESILARFKSKGSPNKPVLLPAKAITSPRETVEVSTFLVMCPSDIITLVNTLFPERRPPSSQMEKESLRRGLASAASSISGVSIPFRTPSLSGDASSVLSLSASSMTSDTTSREPLLDSATNTAEQKPTLLTRTDLGESPKVQPTEEYGRQLRRACAEMARILRHDATAGSCHPCAERWAVLYVSADGKELRIRMRKDVDEDDDTEDDSFDSDSEDEAHAERMDLESDYHQLKEAIAKLVDEYEIPKELTPESESKSFSNRASALRRNGGTNPFGNLANGVNPDRPGSRNPYHSSSQLSTLVTNPASVPGRRRSSQQHRSGHNHDLKEGIVEKPSVLITMLEAAMNQCQARSDFVNAHLYYKTLQQLRRVSSPSLTRNGYASLLNYFSRGPRDSLGKAATAIEEFEAWFVWLKQSQERHDAAIEDMMLGLKHLRDKMWYITDVRNSARYEDAKNVALALKAMGQPTKTLDGKPITSPRTRNASRLSNNFLLKTEAQFVDSMAAPAEYGGPNKLADDQSDMTLRWLTDYGIENFCKGEERIHRFCLEVDKCVNKLVNDGIMEGPVLWSSELYRRDKEILDSGRQKGDLFLTGVGTLSIAGDEEYETQNGRPGPRSLDFATRPSHGSLRATVAHDGSPQNLDSGKWGNRTVDLMDSQDYFGKLSPVLTIDSSVTFWSPFQAQSQSPTSANGIRPHTASSANSTVMLQKSATVNDGKRRFLLDLKQTLTGLLLSDLGTIVFGHGSETDAWFSGDLGEECIQRKEQEERRRRRKKSMRSMKSARAEHRGPAGSAAAPDLQSAGEMSTSSSDATARSSGTSAARKAGLLEFPYNVAFRRLLRKFATHPSPFSKLHALFELEQLIVASLTSRAGRSYNGRDMLPTVPQSPTLGSVPELSSRESTVPVTRAQNLEETIANCEERRSHSMTQNAIQGETRTGSPRPNATGTRSPGGLPSTDMIVDVLQGLFRDTEIRPKTLFRDLQYIASFVPASMLDKSARGKAFWDAGLAALGLKQDVCRVMVEIADDIVAYNTQSRSASVAQQAAPTTATTTAAANTTSAGANGHAQGPVSGPDATVPPTATTSLPPSDPLSRFSMADAAQMLIITAKEGDAVAERELAIFYLTHPDLLSRTVLPLTKPREVFKAELLGNQSSSRRREDPIRSDPMTMCVAQHWMELSSKGGDHLANKYLRARDEMEKIPSV